MADFETTLFLVFLILFHATNVHTQQVIEGGQGFVGYIVEDGSILGGVSCGERDQALYFDRSRGLHYCHGFGVYEDGEYHPDMIMVGLSCSDDHLIFFTTDSIFVTTTAKLPSETSTTSCSGGCKSLSVITPQPGDDDITHGINQCATNLAGLQDFPAVETVWHGIYVKESLTGAPNPDFTIDNEEDEDDSGGGGSGSGGKVKYKVNIAGLVGGIVGGLVAAIIGICACRARAKGTTW